MKIFSTCLLLPIVFFLAISCSSKGSTTESIEKGLKAFSEFYNVKADTCIQLDNEHFLFTRITDGILHGYDDSTYIYVLKETNNEWSTSLSKGLLRDRFYTPVLSAEITNIEEKKYLYIEYDLGGGNMGNDTRHYILYDLQDTINEYKLTLEYYPPNIETSSFVVASKNLKIGSSLYAFLYEKLQDNELLKKDGGVTKSEDTQAMSGWKCYNLIGQVKSVQYGDGSYLEFNEEGNLIKETSVWSDGSKITKTYTYQSPTEYSFTNNEWGHQTKYKIKYEKNTRREIEQEGEYFESKFIFDKQGRLIQKEPNVEFDALTIQYKYKSEVDIFPDKEIENASYEGGDGSVSTISTFEYLKMDPKGNWTERNISQKITEDKTDWDETTGEEKQIKTTKNIAKIEQRKIIYF